MTDDIVARLRDAGRAFIDNQYNFYNRAANRIETLKQVRDHAYRERNTLVAFLSHIYPAGLKATAIAGWDEEWHGCVYIDLPTGQASWHYHNSEAHLFAHLPPYEKEWDGHSNEDKYERLTLAANHAKQTDELLADYIKYADALTAHTNNQNNRIKALETALRPFAKWADWHDGAKGTDVERCFSNAEITVGELRAARKALEGGK